jgi:cell division protease FtsH
VHKVSIIPRGRGALGYTLTLPDEDRYIITKDEILARIRVTLGGRSAEEVIFQHQSTGAEDDLQKATQLARSLVCRWGMSENLGTVAYDRSPGSPFLGRDMSKSEAVSEQTAGRIDQTVREILDRCHQEARAILEANRELLHQLADHLMEREILDFHDFEEAVQRFAGTPPPPLREDLLAEHADGPPAVDGSPASPT